MRRITALAFVLGIVGCNSGSDNEVDECGPNQPCGVGFQCSTTSPHKCIPKQGQQATVDLVVAIAGQGSVTVGSSQPCASGTCTYHLDRGTTASIKATPGPGWRFNAWSGDCSGMSPDVSLRMDAQRSCSAGFVQAQTFNVTVAAETGGSVTSGQLTCAAGSCSGKVAAGSTVTVTATASDGYRFDAWRGSSACEGKTESSIDITMSGDVECRATFVPTFMVSATTATAGATVTVSYGTCSGASCVVDKGSTVTIKAVAPEGSRFTGWTGGEACAGSDPTLTFIVTEATACVASFSGRVSVTGVVGGGLGGTVKATSPDASSTCTGATCVADVGAVVTLVGPTIAGYRLDGWSGAGCETGVVSGVGLTLTVKTAVTCTANYVKGVSVSGTVVGAVGQVTATSSSPGASCTPGMCGIDAGGSVTLAAPDLAPDYRFLGWSGDPGCTGTAATLTVSDAQTSVACSAGYVRRLVVKGSMPQGLTGTITVTTSDPAGVCKTASCTVDAGLTVTLTAPDVAGYRFIGWAGAGCTGDANPLTVKAVDANLSCSAKYVLRVHVGATLTGAAGTVTYESTAAAVCDDSGCTIDAGGDITLTAPDLAPAYRFIGWSGGTGCTGATRAIELAAVAADVACVATYIQRVTITVAMQEGVSGTATIDSGDPNEDCDADSCTVDAGQEVTLTAPTVDGLRFGGWSGDGPCQSGDNPLKLAAAADGTCTATYVTQFTIAAVAGSNGTVSAGYDDVTCSNASCTVDGGISVTLTATPAPSYFFDGWTGTGCPTSSATIAIKDLSATCTASFVHFTIAASTADVNGNTVSAKIGQAACASNTCVVGRDTEVTLTATPVNAQYAFDKWTGTNCTPAANATLALKNVDASCVASFVRLYTATGAASPAAATTITGAVSGVSCGGSTCSGLKTGASVTFTAGTVTAGYTVKGWSMNCPGGAVTIASADVTCTLSYRIAVAAQLSGNGAGVIAGSVLSGGSCTNASCTVDPGTTVTFTVTPAPGSLVTGWSGGCTATADPNVATISASAPTTCTATIQMEWAVSLGHKLGYDDVGAAVTGADKDTVNFLGSSTTPTPSYAMWLHTIEATSGAWRVPNIVAFSYTPSPARGLVQIDSRSMMILASGGRNAPVLIVMSADGSLISAAELPWKSDVTVNSNTPSTLLKSTDGLYRVGSTLNFTPVGGVAQQRGRVSAVKPDLPVAAYKDFTVCDGNLQGKCGECNYTTLTAMADTIGNAGVIMTMSSSVNTGTIVARVDHTGTVKWSKRFTWASSPTFTRAVSLADGSVAFIGRVAEPGGAKAFDAAILWVKADGSSAFLDGSYGNAFGRASGVTTLNERAVGAAEYKDGLVVTGSAVNAQTAGESPSDDAWLFATTRDPKITTQLMYGGAGTDVGAGVFEASNGGFVVGGTTTSFGVVGNEMWALRTAPNFGLVFNPTSKGHTEKTNAVATPLKPDVADWCVTTIGLNQTLQSAAPKVVITEPDFRRQAP